MNCENNGHYVRTIGNFPKRKREGKESDEEKVLSQWISVATGLGVGVSGTLL
jgi:hypothetical protein